MRARWRGFGLFVSMKKIASSKTKTLAAAIHLDVHKPLWAATNEVDSPVHIAAHERISRRMRLHTLAAAEVVCGVV
jgi:hypothetical protein